ncbi:ABC transporter substrate-binding protein, partial [Candidatus Allofournierella excrementavium]
PRPAPAAAPKAAASRPRRRGSRTPLIVLGSLLALLVVCLAGWALDVPARLEGLTLPGGPSSSATVKEGQDWPAMVGDRMVSEKPEKVVSLSPMITEALLSLPGHEALCAVTEYCDARSTGLATVGTPLLPRTEDIIALAPDYVLCQTPLAGPVQTELEEAGVEVIQMDTPADLAALREFYGQLGALLGGNETGRALGYGVIDRLESTLAAYDAALPEKASALLLPDLTGLAATADTAEWTLLGQVFRHPLPDAAGWLAGAECLTDEDAGNDLDQIRAADPDVLLVADTISPEDLSAALGDLRAVQNGAVVYVDIRLTETLSPRLVFAIADAAALAYPEFAPAS